MLDELVIFLLMVLSCGLGCLFMRGCTVNFDPITEPRIAACYKVCEPNANVDSLTLGGECVCRNGAKFDLNERPRQ